MSLRFKLCVSFEEHEWRQFSADWNKNLGVIIIVLSLWALEARFLPSVDGIPVPICFFAVKDGFPHFFVSWTLIATYFQK